jgi:endonuclease/exonuclease/phosphatase family metal-dependent hydrolase
VGLARWTALTALVVSTACAHAVVDTLPTEPADLVVVTWNTHGGRGALSRLVADLERGHLAPPSGAYVLLLQEVAADEVEAVAAATHGFTFFVAVRGVDERARGNAIVSSLTLRNARAVPLPRERQSRGAAAASIDVAGHELFVASAHLENRESWWTGGLFSDAARRRQAESLLVALPAGRPGILGGDFNTWLGRQEATWGVLTQRFPDTPDFLRTPTFRDRLVLDHLFFDLPDGWHAVARVLPDAYDSDHHPVVALVRTASS